MYDSSRSAVVLVPHRPMWAEVFQKEKRILLTALGQQAVEIEHVGSTAIPGLSAKPILDVLLGFRSFAYVDKLVRPLQDIDYQFVPAFRISGLRYFHKGPPNLRSVHLHVVRFGGLAWDHFLMFRDYLRTHSEVASQYEELKRVLAAEYPLDRPRYTAGKAVFVRSVLQSARAERRRALAGSSIARNVEVE